MILFSFRLSFSHLLLSKADEYMEAVVGPYFSNDFIGLRELIDSLFTNKDDNSQTQVCRIDTETIANPFSLFLCHVTSDPVLQTASSWDRLILKRELSNYLHAYATQVKDSAHFSDWLQRANYKTKDSDSDTGTGSNGVSKETSTATTDTFFHWLRTTLANHTACPYAFAFVGCLLSSALGRAKECFPSVCQKYFANAACRHLPTMFRMYNNYGSVNRDSEGGNLNSVDSPEC